MKLPSDTRASRVAWSVAATCIFGVLLLGWAAACARTVFIQKYSMVELVAVILDTPLRELDGHFQMPKWNHRIIPLSLVALPPILWPLCLVPWKHKRSRVMATVVAWLAPCWWVALAPGLMFRVVGAIPSVIAGNLDGEDLEEGALVFAGSALWWWFMLGVVVLSILRRELARAECRACGYSTVGLRSSVCPECGATNPVEASAVPSGGPDSRP